MALVSSSNYFYRILNTFIWKIAVLTVWFFFLPLIPKFNPSKQARNGSHCGGAYSEAWMSAVGRYTGHPPLMFTDSQINNIL